MDVEQFGFAVYEDLPYGRKQISMRIAVDVSYKSAWGNKLFQLQLDGEELKPVGFSLDKGNDGKGFVPPKSGVYTFEIPKEKTSIGVLTFMTAGGTNYNAKISDLQIRYVEEKDTRPVIQDIRVNQIGYASQQTKIALLELPLASKVKELKFQLEDSKGQVLFTNNSQFNQPFPASGYKVMQLDFSKFVRAGTYKLVVPVQEGVLQKIFENINIGDNLNYLASLKNDSLKAFNWFVCGEKGPYKDHEQDRKVKVYGLPGNIMDIYGGWHDAGDYGKYTVNGAFSVGVMLLANLYASKGITHVGGAPKEVYELTDILTVAKHELDWLLTMQRSDGALHHKVAAPKWLASGVAPEQDKQDKVVMPITTTATADFAATMALAYRTYNQSPVIEDGIQAQKYLKSAKQAWQFLKSNPNLAMIAERYNSDEYGGPYTDTKDNDERLWAAAELFNATGQKEYQDYIEANLPAIQNLERFGDTVPDWQNVNFMAMFSLAKSPLVSSALKGSVINSLKTYGDKLLELQSKNPYGIAFAGHGEMFDWGSNSVIATTALELTKIYKLTNDMRYKDGAIRILDYLMGLNPLGISYITGFGNNYAKNPHFRPSMSGKYPVPKGMLVGGVNNVEAKGDNPAMSKWKSPPMQIYADAADSWATNEVAINWQATLASLMGLLLEE